MRRSRIGRADPKSHLFFENFGEPRAILEFKIAHAGWITSRPYPNPRGQGVVSSNPSVRPDKSRSYRENISSQSGKIGNGLNRGP